jgi:hypothetical protein
MKASFKRERDNEQPVYRLVVKFRDQLNLPYLDSTEINHFFSQADRFPIKHLSKKFPGLTVDRLFVTLSPDRISELTRTAGRMTGGFQPDFLSYYILDCPYKSYSNEILNTLRSHEEVELAYIETGPSFPPSSPDVYCPSDIHQGYLKPAPEGIDAIYAWKHLHGEGSNKIKFIDIEQGWVTDPQRVLVNALPSTGLNFPTFKDHGKSVLSVILKKPDALGSGIAPGTNAYFVSQWRPDGNFNTADAILTAISELSFGDIILLEAQVLEYPHTNKLWPVEIQPAIFESIKLATSLGITVIEAGGNGQVHMGEGNDLDNYINEQGRKTLNMNELDFKDSGAILVGAASDKFPHRRIRYSNFGSRINCYAWGERVSTEGSHLGPADIAIESYRNKISGTSSASAIIAGAAILIQGIVESRYHFRLSPGQMRQILSDDLMGTPSAYGRSVERIGSMPDLKKILGYIHSNHHSLKKFNNELN